jgi:hypothetical protein
MKRHLSLFVGLVVLSSMIYGCGKKDDSPQAVQPPACPPGYVLSNGQPYGYQNPYGNPYGQNPYGNPYGQNPYGNPYGQNPYGNPYGQNPYGNPYGQNPYGNPYGQNPYGYQNPYGAQAGVPLNCVPAPGIQPTPIPGTGSGTGTGAGTIPPPAGGVLGTISGTISLKGFVSTTNLNIFNKFLEQNSGRCRTGWEASFGAECNNYTSAGGLMEINGSGSTVQGYVAAGPYTGKLAKGAYMPVSPITFQYFLVNNNQGFEIRAMGSGGTVGYAGILSIRAENVVLTNNSFNVVLSYKPTGSSVFTEFGRATLSPR